MTMKNKERVPEDFSPKSPLRKPMFFQHFSSNVQKYSELVSFFRSYPDLWYDYLSRQGGKQIFFFRDYQRVMLRSMQRFMNPYYCIPRGGSKCITGDTRILTEFGYERIDDVAKKLGLPVYEDKETIMEAKIKMVNRFGDTEETSHITCNGKQETVKIEGERGFSISCTKNHPLLVKDENEQFAWREAKDIKKGDQLCLFCGSATIPFYEKKKKDRKDIFRSTILAKRKFIASALNYFFPNSPKAKGTLKTLEAARALQIIGIEACLIYKISKTPEGWFIQFDEENQKKKKEYLYEKVERVTDNGEQLVYDVCMPKTHSFIANGFVSHNTLIDVMSLYHTAIFYPGSKLGITSGTKEQIVSMWKEKHNEVLRFFPAMRNEIDFSTSRKPRFSKDTGTVYFKNGSWIQSTPVIQASKGGRRTQLSKEESALIDHTDYKDIVSPMMQGSARVPLGSSVADPEELNGKEMSMTTSGFRNSEEFELITGVYKKMVSLQGGFLFGADWRLPYRVGGADKVIVDREREDNETEFRKNYLCEWVGTIDGAIIRMDKLIKARALRFEDVFKINKKTDQSEYVIAVDVAGTGTDTTSICVGRVLKQSNGKIDKIHIVGLYTIPTSGDFKADAIFIKKVFLAFGGDYDLVKSKVKGIVVDANAIGQGLVQELMNNHYDIETNTQLGSFDLMFESSKITRKPENKKSPKLIWDLMVASKGIKASSKNHEIIVNFMSMFNAGNVLMLGTYDDIKQAIIDKQNERIKDESKKYTKNDIYQFNLGVDWNDIELQCNQITAFINEVTNIKLGQANEAQPRYTIKRINGKITKDKFSSISYMLYFAKLYLDEEEEPTSEDINDYVTVGFGKYNMNLSY